MGTTPHDDAVGRAAGTEPAPLRAPSGVVEPALAEAWNRGDVEAAVSGALALDELDAACRYAVDGRRVDLLLPAVRRIERMPVGVPRDVALAVVLLIEGDLARAKLLVWATLGTPSGPAADSPDPAHSSDDALRLTVLADLGAAMVAAGRWSDAIECVREGRRLYGAMRPSGAGTRVLFDLAGLAALAEAHTDRTTTEFVTLSVMLAEPRARNVLTEDHALALICRGSVQHLRGHLGEAALDLTRGIALTSGARSGVATHASTELCLVRVRQGRWSDADDLLAKLVAAAEKPDQSWLTPSILAGQAVLAAVRGRTEVARHLIADASRLGEGLPVQLTAMLLTHARALNAITSNDWIGLHRLLDDTEEPGYRHPYRPGEWNALRMLAAMHLGDTAQQRRRLAGWAREPGAATDPYYWCFVAIQAESEARWVDTLAAMRTALSQLTLECDPLGRAWVLMVAGAVNSRHGDAGAKDPVRGRAFFEQARGELATLGAVGCVAFCDTLIRSLGDELGPQHVETDRVLTEHQLRVAELVADGYTSVEIGHILHLSSKTIDFHVGNIVRRLGLDGRREIPRRLGRVSR